MWALGADPWLIVGSFLIVYSIPHFGLRWWGLKIGLEKGVQVGGPLGRASLGRWADHVADLGCVLLGMVAGVLVMGPLAEGSRGWLWGVAALACFAIGLRRGAKSVRPTRLVLVAVLSVIALVGLLQ